MHPTKSPSLDGLSPIFFQRYWDIVGPYVVDRVLQTLRTGVMPNGLNDIYFSDTKVNYPQKIIEF